MHYCALLCRRWFQAVLIIAAMVFTVGCGSSEVVGRVAGRITVAGKPLDHGIVVFQNAQKNIGVVAPVGEDGKYHARTYKQDGLSPGDYQVAIQPQEIANGAPAMIAPPKLQKKHKSLIPAKYQSISTSGLIATVKPGNNPPFDFDLTP
jgi:hypothetical protein